MVGICKGARDTAFDAICIAGGDGLADAGRALRRYSIFSATQRETAVANLRGAKRVDCATIQLCAPLIEVVRPSMTAR